MTETTSEATRSQTQSPETQRLEPLTVADAKEAEQPTLSRGILPAKYFVVIIALIHGLHEIQVLANTMYAKNKLEIPPNKVQMLMGLVTFHWSIKPVFGYILDKLMRKVRKAKYVMFTTSVLKMIQFSILSRYELSTPYFYLIIFLNSMCYLFENIIAEYLLVVATKRLNRERGGQHNQLPIYFGFRATGNLIGAFFGGRIIMRYGNQMPYYICSIFPMVIIFICLIYREEPYNAPEKRTFRDELKIMKQLLFRDKVFSMMLFVILINMQPNFDNLYTFYYMDILKFSAEQLANFSSFGTICYIIGLISYSHFFRNIRPKPFYLVTNFILWFVNISFLLVVLRLTDTWGIDNQYFCLFSQGFYSFVAEINYMPILAIWCSMCPDSLEATSITLFTGLINLSNNLSNYFGSALIYLFGFHNERYKTLWLAVVVQNFYLLVLICALFCVPFPDPTAVKKESKKIVEIVGEPPAKSVETVVD